MECQGTGWLFSTRRFGTTLSSYLSIYFSLLLDLVVGPLPSGHVSRGPRALPRSGRARAGPRLDHRPSVCPASLARHRRLEQQCRRKLCLGRTSSRAAATVARADRARRFSFGPPGLLPRARPGGGAAGVQAAARELARGGRSAGAADGGAARRRPRRRAGANRSFEKNT